MSRNGQKYFPETARLNQILWAGRVLLTWDEDVYKGQSESKGGNSRWQLGKFHF